MPQPKETIKTGHMERESLEWHSAWDALAAMKENQGDTSCECPETGEFWQYMMSFECVDGVHWVHEFRHRHHPKENRRIVIHLPASPNWRPNAIRTFDVTA